MVSASRVICESPPATGAGSILVSVSTNGVDFSRESLSYAFAPLASIFAVIPSHVSTAGGDIVTISGADFFTSLSTVCDYGSAALPARSLDAQTIECRTPQNSPGEGSVRVGLDGIGFSNPLKLRYQASLTAHMIRPSRGSTTGGTHVEILGANFDEFTDLRCSFGLTEVVAIAVHASKLMCTAPAGEQGVVRVAVKVPMSDLLSSEPLVFEYLQAVTVSSIHPSRGPLIGNT
eukprot:867934-Rhodomonas_salina.1